ncbi:MAG: alpha-2-macroglobulin [Acidobacteria bacterium]|nr:alpha-2-macroglobulin [Acidobacteriota bacterium]
MPVTPSLAAGVRSAALVSSAILAIAAVLAVVGLAPNGSGGSPPPPVPALSATAPAAGSGTLRVVAARPVGPAQGLVQPVVTFSSPVVGLGAAEADLPAPATITPAVPGQWRWLGSASVEFVPDQPLPLSTAFTVRVAAGLRALDGSVLAEPYQFTFETPRPELLDSDPVRGHAWVTPDQLFALTFNQPVRDLAAHAWLAVGRGAHRVALRVERQVSVADEERERAQEQPWRRFWEPPDRGLRDLRTRYELRAAEPLPLETELALTVEADLAGEEGPLQLGERREIPCRTYGPMRFTRVNKCGVTGDERCSYGPIVLLSTNPVALDSLKQRLTFEPTVNINWEEANQGANDGRAWAWLPGDFRPGQAYRVRVAPGATDEFGQSAPAFAAELRMDDLDPNVEWIRPDAVIEAAGDGALPVRTVNVANVPTETWVLDAQEFAAALLHEGDGPDDRWWKPQRAPARRTLDVRGRKNAHRWSPLPLRELLPAGRRTGLFRVHLTGPAPTSPRERQAQYWTTVQLTDLAVHAKLGVSDGLAWVTRLSTGQPVAGAQVSLHVPGKPPVEVQAGPDGTARLPGLAGLVIVDPQRPWLWPRAAVLARDGDDVGGALASWNDGISPWSFGVPLDWVGDTRVSVGMVNPERGIYRPGDEVLLKGLFRFRKRGEILSPPAGSKAQLKVVDSRGTEIAKQEVAFTAFGTFHAAVPLAADTALGWYQAVAELDLDGEKLGVYGGFRVEEYRAPQFQVDVSSAAPHAIAGERLSASVIARYLFGAPMTGAAVAWAAQRETTDFAPPRHERFVFGPRVWYWTDEAPQRMAGQAAAGEGAIGPDGAFAIDAGEAEAPGSRTWAYTLEAEVTDVNRQRVADRATVLVHPAAVYAGLRVRGEGFAKQGQPAEIEAVAVAPDGTRRAGAAIDVQIVRRTWTSIRKRRPGGQWFTETEPVETPAAGCRLTSAEEPQVCRFTPAEPGLYLVAATVTDEQGRTQKTTHALYAIGSGWVSWQQGDARQLELVADKTLYDIDDTARVLVKSPFPEAQALVTVEREGILWSRQLEIKGSAQAIEIPLGEPMLPNVFVSVLLTRGRVPGSGEQDGDDPGRPAIAVGYARLDIEKKSKRLAVDVTPDATAKRPREKVAVDLLVRDAAGRGTRAELTVWAVDEGVLRLTAYKTPDPVDEIHVARSLSVLFGDALVQLLERHKYGEKGGLAASELGDMLEAAAADWGGAGGEAAGAGFRSKFKTTPVFLPEVVTGADGRAHVEFELPDNLTTYRIMALAVGEENRFGTGQSAVVVSKPLLALPALPRFVHPGDTLEAGVVVHARAGERRAAEVTVSAEGVRLLDRPRRTIDIVPGAPREVRFRFAAESPGTAVLRFAVASAGERDGVEQRFPVLLPVRMETVATYGDTRERRVEALEVPRGVRRDAGGLTLTLASTVLGGLEETSRQLLDYPYGCVEQLSSRLVPIVESLRLAQRFGVEVPEVRRWPGAKTEPAGETARATVKQIVDLQAPDGGFRYWPDSTCSSAYASPYAFFALGRAKAAGIEVDPAVLERAQKFLAEQVLPKRGIACGWGRYEPDPETRVFALWALAHAGVPLGSYHAELLGLARELPLSGRAMLADAVLLADPKSAEGRRLLDEVLASGRETAGQLHFQEVDAASNQEHWASDTRTTAIVLLVLAGHDPEHPHVGKIARWLLDRRGPDGAYRNTQEAAFVLMSASEIAATREKEVPDFVATVRLADDELLRAEFKGRSLEPARADVPLERLAKGAGQRQLTFAKEGTGILNYSAALRYAPTAQPATPLDRGLALQRWFERWDKPGALERFAAGELVRVKIRVAAPAERHYVAISVPLPAGLEPLDTSLATSARPPVREPDEGGEGGETGEDEVIYGFWSPWVHTELHDDRVVLFADELPAGVHETYVIARATTPGEFVLPAAQAEEMYAPEVFGRTAAARLVVEPPR